ncbi:methyl-accepting chemotaxis protein [Denitrobaculum tricleocarpae]|uniref:HAMP domain-containing protein n=1 Tax=Denitrobaculum tricleocarpae TaxID=2591009 RepID=A0A545U2H2_9PROT|nr:HAMP domain-containing methyl-accepting chemotaxis protein [Denitrobaculum tricleocarpae]TQV83634.1 HAMP domain-containing protein [Denitrobaculum tricleocarpae]
MLQLSNASIRIKSLIAPGIAVLAMLAVTAAFLVSFERSSALEEEAAKAITQATKISAIRVDLNRAHASILRATVWTANSVTQENIDAVSSQALATMQSVHEGIDVMIADQPAPSSQEKVAQDGEETAEAAPPRLEAVSRALSDYAKAAASVVDEMGDDLFMATMNLNDAEAQLTNVSTLLAEIAQSMQTRAEDLQAQARASLFQQLVIVLSVLAVGAAMSLGAAFLMARAISGPVTGLTAVMTRLADKDTSVEIPNRGQKDEIGQMAGAVQIFKDNAIERQRLEEAAAAESAAKEQRAAAIEKLISGFDQAVSDILRSVSNSASGLDETAQRMSSVAEQTKSQSHAAASASGQTTENVQTVAAASEELASSIQEISRQVAQSKNIADEAVSEAKGTNEKVQGLAEMAKKISEVVTLIQDIAEQTNLLALNATIEAARAGEAGKGFAVVASEVKNLATQTAGATEEIGAQVSSIQDATNGAAEAISSIGGTIEKINEITTGIAAAVEEQSAATGEISSNAQRAASGTQETASTVTEVAEAAGQTGSASGEVLNAARELSSQSDNLRSEIEQFLSGIRAA